MEYKNELLKEGTVKKGGVNQLPTTPRPSKPPKGMGGSGVVLEDDDLIIGDMESNGKKCYFVSSSRTKKGMVEKVSNVVLSVSEDFWELVGKYPNARYMVHGKWVKLVE